MRYDSAEMLAKSSQFPVAILRSCMLQPEKPGLPILTIDL